LAHLALGTDQGGDDGHDGEEENVDHLVCY
jgi:hypothetical protein